MALAGSPDLATLQTWIEDVARSYLRILQWVIDRRADQVKGQRLLDDLAAVGCEEQDVMEPVKALGHVAAGLRNAPRRSYGEIVAACDAVIAGVERLPPPPPAARGAMVEMTEVEKAEQDSLWPE